MNKSLLIAASAALLNALAVTSAFTQDNAPDVESKILALDTILFEVGFNDCQLDRLAGIVAKDLEFYHDLSGPMFGREPFIESLRRNICAPTGDDKPIRRLIENSVEVHPLYQDGELYGVIQTGKHAFYLGRSPNAPKTSTARFTHLWLLRDERWLLSRVLSYAHVTSEPH